MAAAYAAVKSGKLRLKGHVSGLKGKKKRKRKSEVEEEVKEGDLRHGV